MMRRIYAGIVALIIALPLFLVFCAPAPVYVTDFQATPTPVVQGDNVTLRWTVTGATSVTINPDIGGVPLSGSSQVSPGQTTTYSLKALNNAGSATKTVTVVVNPRPPAPPPPAPVPTIQTRDTQALVDHIGQVVKVEGDVTYISSWLPTRFRGQSYNLPWTFMFFMADPWEGAAENSGAGEFCPECWRDYTSYFRAIITPDMLAQFLPYLNANFGGSFTLRYPWLIVGATPGGRPIYIPNPYWSYGFSALQPVHVTVQGVLQAYLSAPVIYLTDASQITVIRR
jgi:hypothetical protein